MTEKYRVAPPGFTSEQREEFDREGMLVIENALSEDEVQMYLSAIKQQAEKDENYKPGAFFTARNIVEWGGIFSELIDHARHVGFAYDFYGELLKLHLSQVFIRVPGGTRYNIWHPDGPRALPYNVFTKLPLQLKIGYWLTDVPHEKMGNMVVLPGSQKQQYMESYDSHESVAGEKILCLKKGTITIMHGGLWHRVEPNESRHTRINMFITYCPSWIMPEDHFHSDSEWIKTLNREQRIIMRNYSYAYDNAKPPAEDFPLFLDRETGLDRDTGTYADRVQLHRRKRKVEHEKK